ncbi:MAG: hypothetical protein MJB57_13120, partial [Gemmatimonadetes bacterium]|nr:hypothetical protein [Gemmatimonadota bacterium]
MNASALAARATCDVCGMDDALGLGVCPSCAPPDSDALLFVAPSDRRADRRALEAWLIEAVRGAIDGDAARDVAEGRRPIVALPATTAGRAAAALSIRGVAAVAIGRDEAWRRVPAGLVALSVAAAGSGLFLGIAIDPLLLLFGPVFGALLLLAARREVTEAVWRPRSSPVLDLPKDAEVRVRGALVALPEGEARARLKDIVAVAASLGGDETPLSRPSVRATNELLETAARAAEDLDRLDRSVSVLETAPAGSAEEAGEGILTAARAARDALAERLDEVLAALVRVQTSATRSPDGLRAAAERLSTEVEDR